MERTPIIAITQSVFRVGSFTYGLLLLVDVARPGAVAQFFSPHWILLLTLVAFGVLLAKNAVPRVPGWLQWIITVLAGSVFAVVTWNLTEVLGVWQVLITVVAGGIPFSIHQFIRSYE